MNIQLTPQERENLIFQDGDYYEVVSGILSVTESRHGSHANTSAEVQQVRFFFESSNSPWGTQEWTTTFTGMPPEGPALLVLYRRGDVGNVFGVVGMANRAWMNVVPILGMPLVSNSTRAAELKKLEMKSLGGAVGGALAATALSAFTFGLGKKKLAENIGGKMGLGSYREVGEQIEATVRSFMFRISRSAEQLWEGGGGGTSGKL